MRPSRTVTGLPQIPQPFDPQKSFRGNLLLNFRAGVTSETPLASLRWGPTHNCSECCAPSTEIVEVCLKDCNDQTSAAWSAMPAPFDSVEHGIHVTGPTPAAVRYAWSNFPQCVLFDVHSLPVGPFNVSIIKG